MPLNRTGWMLIGLTWLVVACGGDQATNPVALFQVHDEQFRIELVTPELMQEAQGYVGSQIIPLGTVVRGDSSINEPWSWHIDPTTLEFTANAIEVCDGLPSHVEDEVVTSDQYCPWSAVLIEIEGLDQ